METTSNRVTAEEVRKFHHDLFKATLPVDSSTGLPMKIALYGFKGVGKTTTAEMLMSNHRNWKRVRFAEPLKRMIAELLICAGINDVHRYIDGDLKEEPLDIFEGKTARHAMQTLGTEWGRELITPKIWVNIAMSKINTLYYKQAKGIIVDDMRFPNEYRALYDNGFLMVRVVRDGIELNPEHTSEGALDNHTFDITFDCGGGINTIASRFLAQVKDTL